MAKAESEYTFASMAEKLDTIYKNYANIQFLTVQKYAKFT